MNSECLRYPFAEVLSGYSTNPADKAGIGKTLTDNNDPGQSGPRSNYNKAYFIVFIASEIYDGERCKNSELKTQNFNPSIEA